MNKWKTIAIIFIIITTLETLLIGWGMKIVLEDEEKENICNANICKIDEYDNYYYDVDTNICYCYNNNEITYQEYIG